VGGRRRGVRGSGERERVLVWIDRVVGLVDLKLTGVKIELNELLWEEEWSVCCL